jgi:hypothetical protein
MTKHHGWIGTGVHLLSLRAPPEPSRRLQSPRERALHKNGDSIRPAHRPFAKARA